MSCVLPNTKDIHVYRNPRREARYYQKSPTDYVEAQTEGEDFLTRAFREDEVEEDQMTKAAVHDGLYLAPRQENSMNDPSFQYTLYLAFYSPGSKVRTETRFTPQCLLVTPLFPPVRIATRTSFRCYVHRNGLGEKHQFIVEEVPARLPSLDTSPKKVKIEDVPSFQNETWLQNVINLIQYIMTTETLREGKDPENDHPRENEEPEENEDPDENKENKNPKEDMDPIDRILKRLIPYRNNFGNLVWREGLKATLQLRREWAKGSKQSWPPAPPPAEPVPTYMYNATYKTVQRVPSEIGPLGH
ncbi:hypothetical protein NM688_g5471 [Phlebia brevispora]|uniref:Uncharacterized protein n=1 Tax=Phlebia brevispora TaxID=194682 RepID=A0ACC1SUP4_9APHY|nr:hypothetical protein NM688_g5471 [Phlebia brevispora]